MARRLGLHRVSRRRLKPLRESVATSATIPAISRDGRTQSGHTRKLIRFLAGSEFDGQRRGLAAVGQFPAWRRHCPMSRPRCSARSAKARQPGPALGHPGGERSADCRTSAKPSIPPRAAQAQARFRRRVPSCREGRRQGYSALVDAQGNFGQDISKPAGAFWRKPCERLNLGRWKRKRRHSGRRHAFGRGPVAAA